MQSERSKTTELRNLSAEGEGGGRGAHGKAGKDQSKPDKSSVTDIEG